MDISQLLKSNEEEDEAPASNTQRSSSVPPATSSSSTKRSQPPHPAETPAKKQSKWSPEEDALIIELRGRGMKWEDISKRLPGRSAISCRLHYQNYLERRSEWDEERKNKLARLYERFKAEMWSKIAEELSVPWRAAEAMHWQLGEQDMARRAGVTPFSLSSIAVDMPAKGRRASGGGSRSRKESTARAQPTSLLRVTETLASPATFPPLPPVTGAPGHAPPEAYSPVLERLPEMQSRPHPFLPEEAARAKREPYLPPIEDDGRAQRPPPDPPKKD